jgi:hypothetical protein
MRVFERMVLRTFGQEQNNVVLWSKPYNEIRKAYCLQNAMVG